MDVQGGRPRSRSIRVPNEASTPPRGGSQTPSPRKAGDGTLSDMTVTRGMDTPRPPPRPRSPLDRFLTTNATKPRLPIASVDRISQGGDPFVASTKHHEKTAEAIEALTTTPHRRKHLELSGVLPNEGSELQLLKRGIDPATALPEPPRKTPTERRNAAAIRLEKRQAKAGSQVSEELSAIQERIAKDILAAISDEMTQPWEEKELPAIPAGDAIGLFKGSVSRGGPRGPRASFQLTPSLESLNSNYSTEAVVETAETRTGEKGKGVPRVVNMHQPRATRTSALRESLHKSTPPAQDKNAGGPSPLGGGAKPRGVAQAHVTAKGSPVARKPLPDPRRTTRSHLRGADALSPMGQRRRSGVEPSPTMGGAEVKDGEVAKDVSQASSANDQDQDSLSAVPQGTELNSMQDNGQQDASDDGSDNGHDQGSNHGQEDVQPSLDHNDEYFLEDDDQDDIVEYIEQYQVDRKEILSADHPDAIYGAGTILTTSRYGYKIKKNPVADAFMYGDDDDILDAEDASDVEASGADEPDDKTDKGKGKQKEVEQQDAPREGETSNAGSSSRVTSDDFFSSMTGPSTSNAGPSTPTATSSTAKAGPATSMAAPSNSNAGPSNTMTGPSNAKAGPSHTKANSSIPAGNASKTKGRSSTTSLNETPQQQCTSRAVKSENSGSMNQEQKKTPQGSGVLKPPTRLSPYPPRTSSLPSSPLNSAGLQGSSSKQAVSPVVNSTHASASKSAVPTDVASRGIAPSPASVVNKSHGSSQKQATTVASASQSGTPKHVTFAANGANAIAGSLSSVPGRANESVFDRLNRPTTASTARASSSRMSILGRGKQVSSNAKVKSGESQEPVDAVSSKGESSKMAKSASRVSLANKTGKGFRAKMNSLIPGRRRNEDDTNASTAANSPVNTPSDAPSNAAAANHAMGLDGNAASNLPTPPPSRDGPADSADNNDDDDTISTADLINQLLSTAQGSLVRAMAIRDSTDDRTLAATLDEQIQPLGRKLHSARQDQLRLMRAELKLQTVARDVSEMGLDLERKLAA